jgi:hypothetical protein
MLCPCGEATPFKEIDKCGLILPLCQDEDEVLVANRYAVVRWFQTARDKIFGKRAPGHDMTVPVLRLDDGTPFFIHEGTRYVRHGWDCAWDFWRTAGFLRSTDSIMVRVGFDSFFCQVPDHVVWCLYPIE